MLVASYFTAGKRFRTVCAATVITCVAAFYLVPILPSISTPSFRKTAITIDDVHFTASGRHLSTLARDYLCSAHKVPPYQRDTSNTSYRRKVYDLFMLKTELDWLEIRLNELASQVDYFVILEAPTTFTGLPKQLYFQDNKERFKEFRHKIIHHVLLPPEKNLSDGIPGTGRFEHYSQAWATERYQRNAMFTQVFPFLADSAAPQKDDVIIVSDIDEIPRPATVQLL
ncbi:hypothetical protein EKO04_003955, partial [Ascochyta lentis]